MAITLQEPQARLLTVAKVADRLRLSVWSIYRMVAREELPAIKLGSDRMSPIRIDERELEAWLSAEQAKLVGGSDAASGGLRPADAAPEVGP